MDQPKPTVFDVARLAGVSKPESTDGLGGGWSGGPVWGG